MMDVMNQRRDFLKYLLGLLLFGSNGVVASFIALQSHGIVLLRSVLGSTFLLALFFCVVSFDDTKQQDQPQ